MTDKQIENLDKWYGGSMITAYTVIALMGLIVGSLGTARVLKQKEPEPETPAVVVVPDPVNNEALKQLTNLDMLVEPCSAEYIGKNGDLLCREMYCRVMTRGVDSKTSGQECEEIANVANSLLIINHCEGFLENRETCYEKYRERK